MRLKSKNIILTGASRGFGKYLAEVLWNEGASLFLVARTWPTILPKASDKQTKYQMMLDLLDVNSESILVGQALKCLGHIDGLINNAAIQGPIGPTWETNWDKVADSMELNLGVPMRLCHLVAPHMLKHCKGKIVNLSGGGATNVRPNYSAYATAKTGLVRFSECLAAELKDKGIDVNAVSPGAMPTDMLPPGEQCKPNAMQIAAECIVWLLSDESNGVTGKLIAAQWDDYKSLVERPPVNGDLFTLRRVSR